MAAQSDKKNITIKLNDYCINILSPQKMEINGPYKNISNEIGKKFLSLILKESFQKLLIKYETSNNSDELDKVETKLIELLGVPEELPTYYFELAGWHFSFKPPDIVESVEGPGDKKLCEQIRRRFVEFAETEQGQKLLSDFLHIDDDDEDYDSEEVTIKGKILKESEKAYFFAASKNPPLDLVEDCPPMWFPKSQTTLKDSGELVMPYWLFNSRFSSIQKKVLDEQEQRHKEIEAKLIQVLGIPSKTTICDCCAKVDIPQEDMTKIESGQLLCPECFKSLRAKS